MKNTGKVKRVCLTLEKEILDWIDMERNNINRSSFINQVVKKKNTLILERNLIGKLKI
jgi:hypothetical protein